ncbi:hypothetical protein [Stenotrophomonas maltophilia]|uniref:hypothetical protein n=1 Tax=Stenotrophomonas maltophilia TaxID=40324 RepID=UPI00066D68E1|nr:hypothetical protein [Stenotrophomonas maltophilia]ELK2666188.1 hypothetical protein [Stenotrophomonas maltophilia]KUJ02031.1 hypothetical protein AR275_32555 [Stenotrophomonas maltophilia]MBH1377762.1 hypothetical protein [Stenotrophomonas maltophilia]MBH1440450.1 hypothetical protein [Stenotrophomonas maltophilia]MBH1559068.1 hypothetical protein [Stenotrophomonas maltophilia]
MDNLTASEIIDRLGGTTEVARICRIKPPSVSEWRASGIPPARRQFLELLRPEAFAGSCVAAVRQLVDSRMSKRALRAKLGMDSDKHLATLLQLPVEQVEAWPEEGVLPPLPQIQRLLGVEPQAAAEHAIEDPDANRIGPVDTA